MKNIIIGTSNYENAKSGNLVSITGDGGNAWGFFGASYKKLAPSWALYQYYINNPDNFEEQELIKYYIKEYYIHRLKNLDAYKLLDELEKRFGENIVLLCHEPPAEDEKISKKTFCHRRLDADFIELTTGIIIPEIKITKEGIITETMQPDYKPFIRKLMKKE